MRRVRGRRGLFFSRSPVIAGETCSRAGTVPPQELLGCFFALLAGKALESNHCKRAGAAACLYSGLSGCSRERKYSPGHGRTVLCRQLRLGSLGSFCSREPYSWWSLQMV